MKKLIPIIAAILLAGCATTKIDPAAIDQYITTHSDTISKWASSAASFAIGLAEKDPIKRDELKADINQVVEKVARGLDAANSTAGGTVTPDQLAADLKVRDPNVQAFLDGVIVIYKDGYDKLIASGKAKDTLPWVKLVLNSMRVLADGLNKATNK